MQSKLLLIIIPLAMIVVLGGGGGYYYLKKISTATSNITRADENIIYDYLDNKTNDLAYSKRGKMYSAFKVLGTSQDKLYLWVLKREYSKVGKTFPDGDAVSVPVVLSVIKIGNNLIIISHKAPEDGDNYGKSLKKLFPSNIHFPISNDDRNYLEEATRIRAEEDLLK